jgi:hypothetical protein
LIESILGTGCENGKPVEEALSQKISISHGSGKKKVWEKVESLDSGLMANGFLEFSVRVMVY